MKFLNIKTLILVFIIVSITIFIGYNLGQQIRPISELSIPKFKFGNNLLNDKQSENNKPLPDIKSSVEERVVELIEQSIDSVVSVIISEDVPVYESYNRNPFENDPFFKEFFGDNNLFNFGIPEQRQNGVQKKQTGAGTGFIVKNDGIVITNKHVVSNEKADYTIILNNKDKYEATVLARDPVNDLAIMKIKSNGEVFPTIPLGDSQKIKLGQTVVAIGNALGEFSNTVSRGIISGLSRSITARIKFGQNENLNDIIQTDTAINPGNSGGPLLNLDGEVIGINTAIVNGAQSIGFAIPINKVKKIINSFYEQGKITYPFLGVRFLIINEELQKQQNLPFDYGALVIRGEKIEDLAVIPGSSADVAGITENTIILEVNNKKITEKNSLNKIIQEFNPGDKIELKIYQKGETKKVSIKLGER